jgi:hypothetical protein
MNPPGAKRRKIDDAGSGSSSSPASSRTPLSTTSNSVNIPSVSPMAENDSTEPGEVQFFIFLCLRHLF